MKNICASCIGLSVRNELLKQTMKKNLIKLKNLTMLNNLSKNNNQKIKIKRQANVDTT